MDQVSRCQSSFRVGPSEQHVLRCPEHVSRANEAFRANFEEAVFVNKTPNKKLESFLIEQPGLFFAIGHVLTQLMDEDSEKALYKLATLVCCKTELLNVICDEIGTTDATQDEHLRKVLTSIIEALSGKLDAKSADYTMRLLLIITLWARLPSERSMMPTLSGQALCDIVDFALLKSHFPEAMRVLFYLLHHYRETRTFFEMDAQATERALVALHKSGRFNREPNVKHNFRDLFICITETHSSLLDR